MAEKVTWMVLKVDLQCPSCYKKIKKILCKFPEIRDQVYDEQKNLVKITVVCCCPEKIRDKLCCKGGKVIKSIDILPPPKPPAEKPKPPPEKPPEKPKPPAEKPPEKPKPPAEKPPEKPKPPAEKPPEKPKDIPKPATDPPKKPDPAPGSPKVPVPANPCPVPVGFCCPQCYEGRGGGPCYYGYGRPLPPPPPCYDYYYYGYGRGCYVSRCDDYFNEENSWACRIM